MAPLNLFWSRFFVLEPFVTLFALLGATYLLFALHKQEKNQQARNGRYWLISGVWLGIAILAKHTAIVTLSVFVVFLLAYASGLWATKTNKFRWQQISLWFAGLALPLLLFTIILISQNAFADFQQFLSGADRVEVTAGFTDKLTVFLSWLIAQPMTPLALVGVGLACGRLAKKQLVFAFPLLWIGAEVTALFLPVELDLSWGGFSHYVLPALAAASLLGGLSFGLWQQNRPTKSPIHFAGLGLIALFSLYTLNNWWPDFQHALFFSDYPMATQHEERLIGTAVSALVPADEPFLVLGNSGFYYWADRPTRNKFFHYPGYFNNSPLGQTAEADLISLLTH